MSTELMPSSEYSSFPITFTLRGSGSVSQWYQKNLTEKLSQSPRKAWKLEDLVTHVPFVYLKRWTFCVRPCIWNFFFFSKQIGRSSDRKQTNYYLGMAYFKLLFRLLGSLIKKGFGHLHNAKNFLECEQNALIVINSAVVEKGRSIAMPSQPFRYRKPISQNGFQTWSQQTNNTPFSLSADGLATQVNHTLECESIHILRCFVSFCLKFVFDTKLGF